MMIAFSFIFFLSHTQTLVLYYAEYEKNQANLFAENNKD